MKKDDAQKLKFFVNDKATLEALNVYVEVRTNALKEDLVTAETIDDVRRLQGAIEELKKIRFIREKVNSYD